MTQLLSSNSKKSNPFTHRNKTYIFREIGNKKNPWQSSIDLFFGMYDDGAEYFHQNGEGGYIKLLSVDVPTNVISPKKYSKNVNWLKAHIDSLKEIDIHKLSLRTLFQLDLIPFRMDYSLFLFEQPKFLLKDQGKRKYEDYNQAIDETPLFSYPSLDPIYSRPILTAESAKLVSTLQLKHNSQWRASIFTNKKGEEFLDDESIFENNYYTSENQKTQLVKISYYNAKSNRVFQQVKSKLIWI